LHELGAAVKLARLPVISPGLAPAVAQITDVLHILRAITGAQKIITLSAPLQAFAPFCAENTIARATS
jgi:hypothetical protein